MVQINGIKVKAVPKALWKALTTLGGVLIGIVLGLALRMSKEHWTMREVIQRLNNSYFLQSKKCHQQIYFLAFTFFFFSMQWT